MPREKTLSIIKPDAVAENHIGNIVHRFEKAGLQVIAMKMLRLTVDQAKAFYGIHAHKPFFQELVTFMTEGPVVVMLLEGENAIAKNRELMGATNPKEAKPGSIRADLAHSIDRNVIHGSDSPQTAQQEIPFFFKATELFPR